MYMYTWLNSPLWGFWGPMKQTGWDRTSARISAAGSCYQSINNLTQPMNEWNNTGSSIANTLLFTNSVWVLLCPSGSAVYNLYPRRLESLNICWCYYKGASTFSSVIFRPWELVWPESNTQPPEWQPDAQPTEPPVSGHWWIVNEWANDK